MLPLCLDPFNQAAFLNQFIELFSGTVLTSTFNTADIQRDRLWDRLADAPGFRRDKAETALGFIQHSWELITCRRSHSSISISKGIFCQQN